MMSRVGPRTILDVHGMPIEIPDPDRLVHLHFRRYAQCPVCSLHLRAFALGHEEIEKAGVREVVIFYSAAEDVIAHKDGLPFDLVADPERKLYREFAVGRGARALLDPRSWVPGVVGFVTHRGRLPPKWGELWGKPADFLLAPDGRILASKRGKHANDQWSAHEVVALARQHAP